MDFDPDLPRVARSLPEGGTLVQPCDFRKLLFRSGLLHQRSHRVPRTGGRSIRQRSISHWCPRPAPYWPPALPPTISCLISASSRVAGNRANNSRPRTLQLLGQERQRRPVDARRPLGDRRDTSDLFDLVRLGEIVLVWYREFARSSSSFGLLRSTRVEHVLSGS